MPDVKAVRYLLANNAALIAVVAANQIVAGVLPQGSPVPAISLRQISHRRHPTMASSQETLCTSRVQLTVHAAEYGDVSEVLALVRAALTRRPGTVNGVNVDSIRLDIQGPDLPGSGAGIYTRSLDVIVIYNE
jgi:hypothetical protein